MSRFVPAEPIPPGEFLQDELDARGWTQADLASITGVSIRQVANLIAGKSGLTPSTASAIAQAFDQDAETWMGFQIAYELARVAQEDRQIKKRAAIYSKVPVKQMSRRGWIEENDDTDGLAAEICRFLKIGRIEEEPELKFAARSSGPYANANPALIAWYYRVRQLAECVTVAEYKETRLDSLVRELRSFLPNLADVRRVPRTLAEYGIRLVIVQHLPKSKVDGAAFWLDRASPAIAISLRYDRIDNFWFTLLHELAHIKCRDESVDVEVMESDDSVLPEQERRANGWAAETLIPKEKMESFILRTRPLYYKTYVAEFAYAKGVHPGIAVGQLQRRKELKYHQLREFLEKVRGLIVGQALTDGWGYCPATKEK
jgi:HTH-type transcriptional regulator/antitoxin HigA